MREDDDRLEVSDVVRSAKGNGGECSLEGVDDDRLAPFDMTTMKGFEELRNVRFDSRFRSISIRSC